MSASERHQELVISGVSKIAEQHGAVTHSSGSGTLPDPPRIGRHEPGILAVGLGGTPVIGEAKLGEDLLSEHSLEQYEDFVAHVDLESDEPAVLVLIVETEFVEDAKAALAQAGASERSSVIGVGFPG